MEADDCEGATGEWLTVPMFFSCNDPETTRQMAVEAGFEILESAVESQVESEQEIPYHWLLACKS